MWQMPLLISLTLPAPHTQLHTHRLFPRHFKARVRALLLAHKAFATSGPDSQDHHGLHHPAAKARKAGSWQYTQELGSSHLGQLPVELVSDEAGCCVFMDAVPECSACSTAVLCLHWM
jgi:hypothetical protein